MQRGVKGHKGENKISPVRIGISKQSPKTIMFSTQLENGLKICKKGCYAKNYS